MDKKNLTYYSQTEEKLNVITHGIGVILSIIGLVLLIHRASQFEASTYMIGFTVFGSSLILLYLASTCYHYFQHPNIRKKLNVIDHIAIYILIAGTYTPFTLVTLKGNLGWTILGVAWGIAGLGIFFKLFFTGRFNTLSTISYVAMGWIIVFAIKPLAAQLPAHGLYWLVAGGIFYTIGAVLYSLTKLKFNHAIFHVFVLLGSFSHFLTVYWYV